jgi:hypothetical protein
MRASRTPAVGAYGAGDMWRSLAGSPVAAPAIQRKSDGGQAPDQVKSAAQEGVRGPSSGLPHADRIQKSFGAHDVSGVKAHVGGAASGANAAMGARAYAMGDHVAFKSTPDLHTAAHEAAHTVQQSQGVSIPSGVGQVGDAYERHADAVADRVVSGQSAENLLSAGPSGNAGAVQHKRAKGSVQRKQKGRVANSANVQKKTTTSQRRTFPANPALTNEELRMRRVISQAERLPGGALKGEDLVGQSLEQVPPGRLRRNRDQQAGPGSARTKPDRAQVDQLVMAGFNRFIALTRKPAQEKMPSVLAAFFAETPPRFLPAGYTGSANIRPKFYGSGEATWTAARAAVIARDVPPIWDKLKVVNTPVIWSELQAAGLLPGDQAHDPAFTLAKLQAWAENGSIYNVDHVNSVAGHWNGGGNNQSDAERRTWYCNLTNLKLMVKCGPAGNCSKGSDGDGTFTDAIGANFTSAGSATIGARQIDNVTYLASSGGPEIPLFSQRASLLQLFRPARALFDTGRLSRGCDLAPPGMADEEPFFAWRLADGARALWRGSLAVASSLAFSQ